MSALFADIGGLYIPLTAFSALKFAAILCVCFKYVIITTGIAFISMNDPRCAAFDSIFFNVPPFSTIATLICF
jgi:hypothetical protein